MCGAKKGQHTLVVRADNRLTDDTLPHRKADWFPYGGIDRPVYIEMLPDIDIESFQVADYGGRTQAKLVGSLTPPRKSNDSVCTQADETSRHAPQVRLAD